MAVAGGTEWRRIRRLNAVVGFPAATTDDAPPRHTTHSPSSMPKRKRDPLCAPEAPAIGAGAAAAVSPLKADGGGGGSGGAGLLPLDAHLQASVDRASAGGQDAQLAAAAVQALAAEVAKLETQPWRRPRLLQARDELERARQRLEDFVSGRERARRQEAARVLRGKRDTLTAAAATAAAGAGPRPPHAGPAHARGVASPPSAGASAAAAAALEPTPGGLVPYAPTTATLAAATAALLPDAPPAIVVRPSEECDVCHVPLRQLGDDVMLVCPRCHMAQPYTMFGTGGGGRGGGNGAVGDGDDTGGAGGGGAASKGGKTRVAEYLSLAQGTERTRPPLSALLHVARSLCAQPPASLPPPLAALLRAAPAVAEERGARGRFRSVADARARLGDVLSREHGVDLDAALRCVTAERVVAAAAAAPDLPRADGTRLRDHAPKAAAALSGFAPRRLPADVEAQVLRMVAEAQKVHGGSGAGDAPDDAAAAATKAAPRMLPGGYATMLRAALQLLGADEFLSAFPVPRAHAADRDGKRAALEAELGWQHLPLDVPPPPLEGMPPLPKWW